LDKGSANIDNVLTNIEEKINQLAAIKQLNCFIAFTFNHENKISNLTESIRHIKDNNFENVIFYDLGDKNNKDDLYLAELIKHIVPKITK